MGVLCPRDCFYDILGVFFLVDIAEVRKAYRKLALKHHPDKGGDPVDMQLISHIWDIMQNRRMEYDRWMSRRKVIYRGGFMRLGGLFMVTQSELSLEFPGALQMPEPVQQPQQPQAQAKPQAKTRVRAPDYNHKRRDTYLAKRKKTRERCKVAWAPNIKLPKELRRKANRM